MDGVETNLSTTSEVHTSPILFNLYIFHPSAFPEGVTRELEVTKTCTAYLCDIASIATYYLFTLLSTLHRAWRYAF